MGNRPVKTKCWIAFLTSKGCVGKKKKNGGSHFIYRCPGCTRSLPVRENYKDIPPLHIHTGCKTLGISTKDFYDWAKKNC